jgi:hypothetical protein
MRFIVVWSSPNTAVAPMSRVTRPTTVASVPPCGLEVVRMLVTSSRPSTSPSRPTMRRISGARDSAV